jgi:large subunit ribosomal protein L9
MKVILLRDVERLGKPYDIVTTRPGYARNYLFPRKLAIPATVENLRGLEKNRKRFSKTIERMRKKGMDIAERLNATNIETTIRVGPDGKSFGSITSQQIVELLKVEGIEIDKKNIVLDEPPRHPGKYEIKVHLGEQIDAVFTLTITEEGE